MSEDWRIASLSQTIDEEEEEDLIPPTPDQDADDPTHDTTALLGVLADSHTQGRRKPPHTLSLMLGDDPDSEPLPFLSLDWEPHFPVTPAQENGHPLEDRLLQKGRIDSPDDDRDLDLALDTCSGRCQPQPGCSAIWGTKTTIETCILRGTAGSNNGNGTTDPEPPTSSTHSSRPPGGDAGGGGGMAGEGGGGGGGGSGGSSGGNNGNGNDRKGGNNKIEEEEESSHEPSSDSSEGVGTGSKQQKRQVPSITGVSGSGGGGSERIASEGDLFASQDVSQSVLTPSKTLSILQPSQSQQHITPESPERLFPETPLDSSLGEPSSGSLLRPRPGPSPLKRRRGEDEGYLASDSSSDIPHKQRRIAESTESSESGEEKVFVDYPALTRKDVEISPKQKRITPKTVPTPHSHAIKSLTFQSSGSENGSSIKQPTPLKMGSKEEASMFKDPSKYLMADTEDEGSEREGNIHSHLMEVEKKSDESGEGKKSTGETKSGERSDVKLAVRSLPMPERMQTDSQASESDDSDIEIIEGERSVECVYEKPKARLPFEEPITSQDLSLKLVLTPSTQSFRGVGEADQRFSQDVPFQSPGEEEDKDSSLRLSESEPLLDRDSQSQSQDQRIIGSMSGTQMEKVCKPAIFTQPDVESLITLPLSSSSGSKGKPPPPENSFQEEKDDSAKDSSKGKSTEMEKNVKDSPPSDSFQTTEAPRLQMPSISTPTSQDYETLQESESLFEKASKAAKQKIEEKRIEDEKKKKELDKSNTPSNTSIDRSEMISVSQSDSRIVECASRDIPMDDTPSTISTPGSCIVPTTSSESTPVTSRPLQHRSSQIVSLFSSVKKKKEESFSSIASEGSQSQGVFVPMTDSEDEDTPLRKRKKSRTSSDVAGSTTEKLLNPSVAAHRLSDQKTSTPNTSQGVSPNISNEGGSYIATEMRTSGSGPETSKSHEASPDDTEANKSVEEIVKSPDSGHSIPDTEVLPSTRHISSLNDIIRFGFQRTVPGTHDIYINPETKQEIVYFRRNGHDYIFDLMEYRRSGSGGRLSDVSAGGSSGYLGDRSSSSDSSRRASTISSMGSSRLSLSSVVTVGSPPRYHPPKDSKSNEKDDGIFIIPQAPSKSSNDPQISSKQVSIKESLSSVHSTSDDSPPSPERRAPGRARGRGRGRGTPGKRTPGRGRGTPGKGRGRGRGVASKDVKEKEEDDDFEEESPEKVKPINEEQQLDTKDPESFFSLEPRIRKMLERAPLSEEEEEAFVRHGGADAESQRAHVLKRVREVELETGLLVFARFTDNNFYSAVLIDQDGTDRWNVQFTLDQYQTSVREVYLLPTDLLPRGQSCFVRHVTESYSDPGVVKGHVKEQGTNTLLHIIETDRGVTQRVPHSHLFLTGQEAQRVLQARLDFRSLVASPGRELSLDNILIANRRRRNQKPAFYSPRSFKADDNLDTTEGTAADTDDPTYSSRSYSRSPAKSPARKRPVKSRRGTNKQNLAILQEESEDEDIDVATPKRQKKSATPRTPRTPIRRLQEEADEEDYSPYHTPSTSRTTPKKRTKLPAPNKTTQTPQELVVQIEDLPDNPLLGPIPSEGSQLFKGYVVLMTSGESSLRKSEKSNDEELLPFHKDYLTAQVIRGGGRTVEKYSEAEIILAEQGRVGTVGTGARRGTPKSKKKKEAGSMMQLLLITNTYCRTAKYIQCLAAGVPIVSHQWVIHSCAENAVLHWSSFLLPAGETENGNVVEQQEHQPGMPEPQLVFTGERIFLASSTNPEFNPLWHPLLETIGARVRVKPQTGNLNRVMDKNTTVVVGDPSISEEEQQRAGQLGVPVVATEWVIQSLITGTKLPYYHSSNFCLKYPDTTTTK